MYLFKLFGLDETLTYLFIGVIAVLVILFIIIFIFIARKEGKKKKSEIDLKKIASRVDEAKIAQLKLDDKEERVVEKPQQDEVVTEETLVKKPVQDEVIVEEKEINKPTQDEIVVEEVAIEEPVKEEVVVEEKAVQEEENTKDDKSSGRYKGKYIVFQDADFFRYRLNASNGECLVTSEPYTTEKGARSGIGTLKRNVEEGKIDIVSDKHGLYHFRLITKANRILVQSASYETEARAISASKSFQKFYDTDNIVSDEDGNNTIKTSEKIEVEVSPDSSGKYVIEKVEDGYQYVLKASNGIKICASKTYKSTLTCKQALETFRQVVYMGDFYIHKDKNNNYQFKLYNAKNRLVMTGEIYSTKQLCINAVESIKRFAKFAEIVE